MTKKAPRSEGKRANTSKGGQTDQDVLLESLRTHKQVVESDDPDVTLKPGETHVYVKPTDKSPGLLIEKRKSFFKR